MKTSLWGRTGDDNSLKYDLSHSLFSKQIRIMKKSNCRYVGYYQNRTAPFDCQKFFLFFLILPCLGKRFVRPHYILKQQGRKFKTKEETSRQQHFTNLSQLVLDQACQAKQLSKSRWQHAFEAQAEVSLLIFSLCIKDIRVSSYASARLAFMDARHCRQMNSISRICRVVFCAKTH